MLGGNLGSLFYEDVSVMQPNVGAQLAQLVECRTLDCKGAGSNLTRGMMLCP